MILRAERDDDAEAIGRVTEAAFRGHPHSAGTEARIVEALRREGALTISLVAEREGEIVGHVGISPVVLADGGTDWYGLGPLSVAPGVQRQGIGTALVRESLALLKARGAKGCVLAGDRLYYGRFGFAPIEGLVTDGIPDVHFLALPFGPDRPSGTVRFHPGFFVA